MGKNRAYRATAVKSVHLEEVIRCREGQAATVGVDIGKEEAQVMVRWGDGTFERPWRVKNPGEVRDVTELLTKLSEGRSLKIGMEPTGTYGDAFRQAWTDAGLEVHRVGGKAVHDYAEIFDGVPSQHDGKDAGIVAELVALGKSSPWPYRAPTAAESEMAYWVDWLDAQQTLESMWIGRLEALMARHWPEATGLLRLDSVTLLKAMSRYGGPGKLAEDKGAAGVLAGWGGPGLTEQKIQAVLGSAAGTVGVRPCGYDLKHVQRCASMVLSAFREIQKARKELVRLGEGNEVLQRQSAAVGTATACVLWVALGDPRDYRCGEAYRKAMGLNLKERSSGKYEGKLKITKRGASAPRRWLYFAAMRWCQRGSVRRWYERKKTKDKGRGEGALVAIARKLSLALYRVAVDEVPFDPSRLFPGCDKRANQSRGENGGTDEKGDAGSAKRRPKRATGEYSASPLLPAVGGSERFGRGARGGSTTMAGVDFKAVQSRVPMAKVLELAGFEPNGVVGAQLHGPCPVHGSRHRRSRTFSVQTEKGVCHCHKCGFSGNQIQLWARLKEMSVYDAAIDLCREAGVEVPWIEQW